MAKLACVEVVGGEGGRGGGVATADKHHPLRH